jgi:hypothetical protein
MENTVAIVGLELFLKRMNVGDDLGRLLHGQLILTLEGIGNEIPTTGINRAAIRLGIYLDSNNEGARHFIISDDSKFDLFYSLFGHSFYRQLEASFLSERKKGADVLFQLNSGELSLNDFDKYISKK